MSGRQSLKKDEKRYGRLNIIIRNEENRDYRRTGEVAREVFGNLYAPGAVEHYVIHKMRSHPDFIRELSFVLKMDGVVEGAIFYTHSKVVTPTGEFPTISFGPVFISPQYHRQGLGRELIEYSIGRAKEMGYAAILTLGYPYPLRTVWILWRKKIWNFHAGWKVLYRAFGFAASRKCT